MHTALADRLLDGYVLAEESLLHLLLGDTTTHGLILHRMEFGEGQQGGAHQVDGVVVAERLAEHVAHTGSFKYRTHSTTGYHAGTGSSGLEVDSACAVGDTHIVGDGAADERHTDHVLLGVVARLADRVGDLGGFTCTGANHALTVTYHYHRAEVEPAATFHHFGDTVDLDQLLIKL